VPFIDYVCYAMLTDYMEHRPW